MKIYQVLAVISLAYFAFAEDEAASEHVLELTQDNFDDMLKEHEHILVKFYAPWCGHCKALAPEYEKAAAQLAEEGSKVKLGKVDATVHSDLGSRFKVQGYPTLKFFKNGAEIEYNGPRKADGIISWIAKKLGPALNEVKTAEELEKLKTDNKVLAVFFSTSETDAKHKTVNELAGKTDSIAFALVKDEALGKTFGVSSSTPFVLFKQFDEPKVEYKGAYTLKDLEDFIKMEKVPLVTEFSQETAQAVFESEIKMHIIAFSGKKNADYSKHMDILKEAAISLKGKCHVVIIDMDDEETSRVGEFFGVTAADAPTFRVLNMKEDMVKYHPVKKDFTAENIKSFTNDVIDGKVKPHLKSAEEPADWDKEPVKVLVAKTFTERAVSSDKAVFVEFYAPWCGHCKALAPIWDELGAMYKDNAEVMIAKCDATENELEDIKVQSFPTLKFSPKQSTEWIEYKGERTKEALIKFIESNGKVDPKDKKSDDEDGHDEL